MLALLALNLVGLLAAGCGTMRGAGEDIEDAGEFIQETAEDVAD